MTLPLTTVVPVALFHEGPFRWRVSVRSVVSEAWLQFDDDDLAADLAEKHRILATVPDDSMVALPGSEVAGAEVAALVDEALRARGGLGVPPGSAHPLERAARCVHEDLLLLERDVTTNEWRFTAGAVCFPTRWSPAEKLGLGLGAIHAPVPRYDAIASAVDRLFDRIRPGLVGWRANWSVVGDASLRLPVDDRQAPVELPADPNRDLYLRVERQTIRRLQDHRDAAVFGVRVHRWPLGEVLAEVDELLAGELRSMPSDVATYKNLDEWRHALADHLDPASAG